MRARFGATRLPGRRIVRRAILGLDRVVGPFARRVGLDTKGAYEYAYWRSRHHEEGVFQNRFYAAMFTTGVGLTRDDYRDKRVLDVGCGPRGSLEWAGHARERVGLDPLVDRYRRLGIDAHAMDYVGAPAEDIPFPDEHFDVVTSLNSLDHVDDVDASLAEMTRVLVPGGMLVVVVDVHRRPTVAEPQTLDWDLGARLADAYEIDLEAHVEKDRSGSRMGTVPFDHDDPTDRDGVIVLRATKRRPDGDRPVDPG